MQAPSHLCARGYVAFLSSIQPSPARPSCLLLHKLHGCCESWSWAGREFCHPSLCCVWGWLEWMEARNFCVGWMLGLLLCSRAGKSRCKGDYGWLFGTRVCTRAARRAGWALRGTPEPGTIPALTGTRGRVQETLGDSAEGLQWLGTALGLQLFLLGSCCRGEAAPQGWGCCGGNGQCGQF